MVNLMMASSNRIPRELNESIRTVLGKNVKVTLKCPVRMETKGDKTENKVLVFSAFRFFVIAAKIPCKIDVQFHYLEIQSIESKKANQLCLQIGDKIYTFYSLEPDSNDVDIMVVHIEAMLRNVFPTVPLEDVIRRIEVIPPQRIQALYDNNRTSLKKDVGPCGGFSKQYAAMCDYHGLPYREEVAWDVDTIYLSHDTKELCIHDFDHLDARDLVPIISALEHNTWFIKLRASNTKLSPETLEQVLNVMKKNSSLEEIYFDGIGIKWEFAHKLSLALIANNKTSVHTMDFSNNLIEDKGISSLCGILAKLSQGANHIAKAASKSPKGIVHLNLAKTGLTSKGVNTLIHALSVNKFMPNTLTYLNLADNNLKEEVNNLYNFLAQPNCLTHLDLSGTECSIDLLFGALLRGCCQKLSHINLSRNAFMHKKSKDSIVPPSFKQFFLTTIGLKYLNFSMTKIPLEALKQMMLGLSCNEAASDVELDLSNNGLGAQGAHIIEMCIPEMKCLSSLDVSENALEPELGHMICALSKNKSIRRLSLGRNFTNAKSKRVSHVMESLVQMIQEEDCMLEYLSLADSRLKTDIYNLINALGSNNCLVTIDISGNQMGDVGARLLAKALQINNRLRALIYDKNCITGQGFHDLAYAMESNYTVRYMPFPLHDALIAMKSAPEKTESALRKIENLVHRNVSPKKYSNSQAFRLQQGFLLSSTQQMVDKLVVQTQETVSMIRQATGDAYKDNLDKAVGYIQDANNSKQLITRFQEVVLQREEAGNPVELKLTSLSQELTSTIEQVLQTTVASMMKCCEEQCPNVTSDEKVKQCLQQSCQEKSALPKNFVQHCVVEMAGTDILNKVNELHLAVAADLSDRIVDQVIDSLTHTYKSLLSLSHKRRSMTPEAQRNRIRTDSSSSKGDSVYDGNDSSGSPRATPQLSSKRKTVHSRKLRPQSVVDEDFLGELPGSDQKLEHLVKDRPKRLKTRAASRPAVKTFEIKTDQDLNEGLDNFFQKSDPSLNSIPSSSHDNKSSIPSLTSISEIPTKSESNGVLDRSSRESLTNKQSPDGEPTKKDSFREKNSKSFMKGLNSVFGRSSQDKFQRSKSMDQAERTITNAKADDLSPPTETVKAIASPPPFSKSLEIDQKQEEMCKPAEVALRRHPGLSKMGMGGDMLAEMKARQEKRLSAVIQGKGDTSGSRESENSQPPASRPTGKSSSPRHSPLLNSSPEPNKTVPLDTNSVNIPASGTMPKPETDVSESSPKFEKNQSPGNKPGLPSRFRLPPIAPKPRPRSAISMDARKSEDFSPLSEASSEDVSGVNSPEGLEDSTDSGVVGSKDSLSSKEIHGESHGTADDSSERKSSSLPRSMGSQDPTESLASSSTVLRASQDSSLGSLTQHLESSPSIFPRLKRVPRDQVFHIDGTEEEEVIV